MHGISTRAPSPVAVGLIDGFDRTRKKRVESLIRRLLESVRATSWTLGLLDSNGDIVRFDASRTGLDNRTALTLLSMVPLPETRSPVALRAPSAHSDGASVIAAATPIGSGRSLALVLVRSVGSDTGSGTAETMQSSLRQLAEEVADGAIGTNERTLPGAANGSHGFFLLNPELQVELEWHSQDALSIALAELAAAEDARLPPFLERAVKRLTAAWNFSNVAACQAGSARPVPGLTLRVVPMNGVRVGIGVFLDHNDDWHHIDAAAAAFKISPREREVLHELLDGSSVAEIAAALNLAESTVNDHIARMIAKTNARNRIEMAAALLGWPAIRARLFDAPDSARDTNGSAPVDDEASIPRARCSWRYNLA